MNSKLNKVVLIGTPNSGKTTLFNWLTGSQQKAVNYPGSTVDFASGELLQVYGEKLEIFDSPGIYSLYPKTTEEEITIKLLFDKENEVDVVVAVIDSTQLPRQVHLIEQLKASRIQFVVALTMHDLYLQNNLKFNHAELEKLLGVRIVPINGILGAGTKELVAAIQDIKKSTGSALMPKSWSESDRVKAEALSAQVERLHIHGELPIQTITRKIDRFLLHPTFGLFVFIAIMTLLFSSIFWLAAPFMDYVDEFFGFLSEKSGVILGDGLFSQLISEGLIASVGAVLVFVPQIFILFLGITALEDSGYLARSATLIDGILRKIGLEGKSFVPLVSGFACAIPAMMAARNISSAKSKLITLFIIPFMTCSARLPVYALLISFLFFDKPAWQAGLFLTGLYLAGLIIGAITSFILSKMITISDQGFFMMELPYFRAPKIKNVFLSSMRRTKSYVFRSGPAIFTFALLIWVLTTFPNYKLTDVAERLETSYAGRMGKVIEPVFEPMGADWRVGVGLISAFAAREIFVSSLAIVFHVTDIEDEEGVRASLLSQMRTATWPDGRPVFTFGSVMALCVFFVIALQCLSTTGLAMREHSKTFAMVQLVSMNLVAYILAILTYNVLGP